MKIVHWKCNPPKSVERKRLSSQHIADVLFSLWLVELFGGFFLEVKHRSWFILEFFGEGLKLKNKKFTTFRNQKFKAAEWRGVVWRRISKFGRWKDVFKEIVGWGRLVRETFVGRSERLQEYQSKRSRRDQEKLNQENGKRLEKEVGRGDCEKISRDRRNKEVDRQNEDVVLEFFRIRRADPGERNHRVNKVRVGI